MHKYIRSQANERKLRLRGMSTESELQKVGGKILEFSKPVILMGKN
jgi:hypothetical protein